MRKYLSLVLVAMLMALIPIVSAETSASASRSIETSNLMAGNSTNVTVNITNSVSQAVSLMENVPAGWTLTRIVDDADSFRATTNEWVWFHVGGGVTKTVIYKLTVPSDAASGNYNIGGNITNSSGIITGVTGDNLIVVSVAVTPTPTPTPTTPTPTPTAPTPTPGQTPTVTVTATQTVTETVTVPPTTPTGVPVPEYPVSSSLVLSIASIMLVALMLLIQNKKGK
jgi:hypothetical protein